MEDESKSKPSPFDVRTIKYLVRLMGRHDLTEVDLRDGELRVRLRRGPQGTVKTEAGGYVQAPVPALQPAPAVAPPLPSPAAEPAKKYLEIKSPTPGTFYTSSSPDTAAFVQIGSKVQSDTVVCIIEAMKVFNEITAECAGTIAAILVENQQPVEYGQVLFKVDPTG